MRQNFLLFLISPLCLFATIEIAKQQNTIKEVNPQKKVEQVEVTSKEEKAPILEKKKEKEMIATKAHASKKVVPKKVVPKKVVTHAEIAQEDHEEFPKSERTAPAFLEDGHQKQFFITLILICAFILFALIVIYIFKRASPMSTITRKNSRNNIKILERRSLSPQTYLYHIQVGDKQFILSESKVDVRSVATLDWPDPK